MGMGYLTLNWDYITEKHPEGTWPDAGKNFAVVFQFDPSYPDIELNPPWTPKDGMDDELNVQWDFGKSSDPETRTLQIRLDDNFKYDGTIPLTVVNPGIENLVKNASSKTTKQSIMTLEAMALPIAADFVATSAYTKAKNYLAPFLVNDPTIRYPTLFAIQDGIVKFGEAIVTLSQTTEGRLRVSADQLPVAEQWLNKRRDWRIGVVVVPQEKSVTYQYLTTEWHEPRPLRLYLGSTVPWDCQIKDMTVEILRFSTVGGQSGASSGERTVGPPDPSSAIVTLNLIEWQGTNFSGLMKDMSSSEDNKTREQNYKAAVASNRLLSKVETDYKPLPGKEKISTQRIRSVDVVPGQLPQLGSNPRR